MSNETTYYANSRVKDNKCQHIVCATFITLYHHCSTTIYYYWRGNQNRQGGPISATKLVPGGTNLVAILVPGGANLGGVDSVWQNIVSMGYIHTYVVWDCNRIGYIMALSDAHAIKVHSKFTIILCVCVCTDERPPLCVKLRTSQWRYTLCTYA